MAIEGNDGLQYSFESTALIEELKQDIAEFGNMELYAWYTIRAGVKLYTNYAFPEPEMPLDYDKQVKPDEDVEVIRANDLLAKLEQQNSLI